ncbi:MAG: primosomal protein N' [Arenicellales bacterium]|nr:primosomal protein N' [Arenicellales bacterium]
MDTTTIIAVALPVPLRRSFDFKVPSGLGPVRVGIRVRVPFGRRRLIGIVVNIKDSSDIPLQRLRDVAEILDSEPIYSSTLFDWLQWIADYYHHPLGEVLNTALPVALRQGRFLHAKQILYYRMTRLGHEAHPEFNRAPVQKRIWHALHSRPLLSPSQLAELGKSWRSALGKLIDNGWVEIVKVPPTSPSQEPHLKFNREQTQAVESISASLGSYKCFVLFGITGSGKTEVYLQVIRQVIGSGKQALVLVPEIGLTPQLVKRFEQRIGSRLAVLHSSLSTTERHRSWSAARDGTASIVLGTRSAVFTPLLNPGLIVIDEEHDLSFKQQEGLRYHARDVAVLRAKRESIPIVLGSATPSFESMANVAQSRYDLLRLGARPLGAHLPRIDYVDLRRIPVEQGMSRTLIDAIAKRLNTKEQSLIFINRRGYAPVLFCSACGWQAQCKRCDTKLIYHRIDRKLRCHHCGLEDPSPEQCPDCAATSVVPLGEGTQRLEDRLRQLFPSANIVRIDRDSTRRKGELEQRLSQATAGTADILVGTQLLAKGHHFPMVTLVGVVDADQGLYSVDFRATEYLFQQIMQVAGRSGRATSPGQVLVQTVHPDHFHFSLLQNHDYTRFVEIALKERERAQHPPFTHFVLLRAESTKTGVGLLFLEEARKLAIASKDCRQKGLQIMDPVPSPMEKRAGRYRAQLLISSHSRPPLHALLDELVPRLESHDLARRVRWSIDVDPMEMY